MDLDLVLIRRVRGGERAAFRLLVDRWQSMIYGLHVRMTGSPEQAEELAQETFLRAFERLHEFQGSSRFSTWLYSIARNLCLDHLKRPRLVESRAELERVSEAPGPEQAASDREIAARIESILLTIAEGPREAFILRHIEGLEYEEIAERCSTTVNNVKVRVHRAREALSRALQRDDGAGDGEA